MASFGVSRPFVLFVSSLWRYKNCDGLLRAWKLARHELAGRQLVIVGAGRDESTRPSCTPSLTSSASPTTSSSSAAVPLEETALFYQAADLLVYPSLNETFGLPILEAMACACPVVTSNISAMPETAGGAAVLADPHDPASLARAILDASGAGADGLRAQGLRRAQQFTWAATAEATLDVYREVAERRTPATMKILVTGGAGFIGSHTADRLLELGHEVIVLDALTPPVHRGAPPPT